MERCGGEGCDGVVTMASSVWLKAQESQREIISAMEEVEKLSKMVGLGLGWLCFLVWFGSSHLVLSSGVGGQAAGGRSEAERSRRPDEDQQNQREGGPEQRGAEEPHQTDPGLPHPYVAQNFVLLRTGRLVWD